jgi:hypothetical protein
VHKSDDSAESLANKVKVEEVGMVVAAEEEKVEDIDRRRAELKARLRVRAEVLKTEEEEEEKALDQFAEGDEDAQGGVAKQQGTSIDNTVYDTIEHEIMLL